MNYRLSFNLAVSIIAAVVLMVLIFISVFSNVEKRKTAYYFLWSLVSALICMGLMVAWYAVRLSTDTPIFVVKLLGTLVYVTLYAASYAFLLYCLSFFGRTRRLYTAVAIITGIFGIGFTIVTIISGFNDMFFTYQVDNGFNVVNNSYSFIPFIYVWLLFLIETILIAFTKGMRVGERIVFLAFVTVPAIALIFHIVYPELSIFSFAIVTAFLSHFLYFYVQRGLMIQKQEKELSEKQIELTISQIRPHFIYNCLSSISYLCTKDPQLAVEAIDDFSSFLRVNFSNISQNKIVPFSQELEHTKKYLKLEKMRFEERVRVYYDIQVDNFQIPSLTLQPLVENAVKHGICKKAEGGTIIIRATESDKEYLVEVIDDGVGFDPNVPPSDGRVHVGVTNVKNRLKNMVNGRLDVYSKINNGTRMSIRIPKGE